VILPVAKRNLKYEMMCAKKKKKKKGESTHIFKVNLGSLEVITSQQRVSKAWHDVFLECRDFV
jgi:hypothetical protein